MDFLARLTALFEAVPEAQHEAALAEAAAMLRRSESQNQIRDLVNAAIRTKYAKPRDPITNEIEYGPYVRDIYGDAAVFEQGGKTWQVGFTITRGATLTCALADPVEVEVAYIPVAAPVASESAEGEVAGDFVPLTEAGKANTGTVPLKLIAPGWGSSGYYGAAVLERDGPKVFAKGTKMYWNHPTKTEEAARPERDLRDLAAVLQSDARWDAKGPDGPGLYSEAKVFGTYKAALPELAPHIGVSIRALGKVRQGEAEGRKGSIVESIVGGKSVDFVTAPGAGGKVLELFEAAGRGNSQPSPAVEEKGSVVEEKEMAAIQEAVRAEFAPRLTALEDSLKVKDAEIARLREGEVLRSARVIVVEEVAKTDLPGITKARIAEALASDPPTKDGSLDRDALVAKVTEAVKTEREYIATLTGAGRIRGMGGDGGDTTAVTEADTAKLENAFARLGYDGSTAKLAAAGRA